MKDISLYIHIPFCSSKCYYCDFTSYTNKNHMIEKYIEYLKMELSLYIEELKDYAIKTIFIGGGTPSLIDERYIEEVLAYIYDNFNTSKAMETTIEVNPGSLSYRKAESYQKSGINRISLGAQTFNDNLLKNIGRIHRAKDILTSYDLLKSLGFNNINFDMIFDLPGQTRKDVEKDLNTLTNLDINHISYYSLIIEPGTSLDKWNKEGKLNFLSEDDERQVYHNMIKTLESKGYKHYEISNFAKEAYQCQHNKTYWEIKPYIGLGLNSHSYFKGERFWNYSGFDKYFHEIQKGKFPIEGREIIDTNMEMGEYCIFGIRLIEGINKSKFKNRFKTEIKDRYGDVISKHINNGLLIEDNDFIRLTKKGLDLGNQIEVDFLP